MSAWLAENARVGWLVDAAPWDLEDEIIRTVEVPLNLDQNRHGGFHATLTALRATAVARARSLPVLSGPEGTPTGPPVLAPNPYRLDADHDGIGCES